jgi:hypothetical protein
MFHDQLPDPLTRCRMSAKLRKLGEYRKLIYRRLTVILEEVQDETAQPEWPSSQGLLDEQELDRLLERGTAMLLELDQAVTELNKRQWERWDDFFKAFRVEIECPPEN